jgi:hypothetical protein
VPAHADHPKSPLWLARRPEIVKLFPLHRTRLAAARPGFTPALHRLQVIPRPITAPSSAWPVTPA